MLKKTKGQSGITLVALVVTIVVLLILAGITIALVFAQNGVVGKAQEAAKESNKGTIADNNIQGYVVSKQMEALQSNAEQDITADLKAALTKVGITNSGSGTVKVKADTTVAVAGTITFTLGGQSYNFTAYNNGYPTLEAASTTVGP